MDYPGLPSQICTVSELPSYIHPWLHFEACMITPALTLAYAQNNSCFQRSRSQRVALPVEPLLNWLGQQLQVGFRIRNAGVKVFRTMRQIQDFEADFHRKINFKILNSADYIIDSLIIFSLSKTIHHLKSNIGLDNPIPHMLCWEHCIISINNSNFQIFSKKILNISIVLKILRKMEHLLLRSKCYIFHNILKKILHFKGVQRRLCGVKG